MAIETLREGDLVIARNEETGVSGVFPVTAVMGRQASEVLWLTLESADGKVTRMGVTPTHPLFIAGTGWGEAGDLAPGDAIRDKDLQPLTVLAVELDTTPQMVHNLEIAEAHTYFAGELEAWGHNALLPFWWKKGGGGKYQPYDTSNGQYVCKYVPKMALQIAAGKFGQGFQAGWGGKPPQRGGGVSNKCGYTAGAISKLLLKLSGG